MIKPSGTSVSTRVGLLPATFAKAAIVLGFFVSALSAQSTGSIQGTVKDASGAVVPDARVTVLSQATGQSTAYKTDSEGLYAAPALPPANYKVQVEAIGMQAAAVNDVVVAVGSVARQDFTVKIAAASTVVEIQAATPAIDTSSVSVGSVINQRTVQDIPLNGRHFTDLALLIPGTVTPPQNGSLTAPLRGQGAFSFNSAGGREDTVNFMINGINLNDPSQNQITFQPTLNTVDEFKVDNQTYGAEYGRNSGPIVNIATKSGTNAIHGTAYEYLRNNAFDARNFGNPSGIPQSPFKRSQFGGDGGGPIKKDKTFFYLSYEELKQRQSVPLSTPVLSAAQRTQAASSDPIVQKLVGFIPLANSPGNLFVGNAIAPVDIYQGTANITHSINESNRFNAYYAIQRDIRNEPPTTDGNNLPGYGDARNGWRQLLTLNEVATLSPTLVNEARLGFNRIHIVFAGQNTLNSADYGISTGINAAIGLPQISIAGGTTEFGGISGFPQGRGDDTIVGSDTLSWVHGKHSLKFGGEYRRTIVDSFTQTPGFFSFATFSTFLADQANSFSTNTSNRSSRLYTDSLGAFIQDSWKVSSSLTLNLGLRYDWNGTPVEAGKRFVVFDPVNDSLVHIGQTGGLNTAFNQNALNFEPRVGFSWDPFGSGKTVIRSAYAIMLDQPNMGVVGGLAANPPYALPVSYTTTTAVPYVSFGNAYSLASGALAVSSVSHSYRDAYVQNWNFNIQQQIGTDFRMMAGYFGSKGTDLNVVRNYNQPVNGVRPYPRLSSTSAIDPGVPLNNITVNESVGNSSYNALWLTAHKSVSKGLQFDASYTFAKSIDENSRNFQGLVIQDSYNVHGDRGLSDFDARHRLTLSGIYDLPFKRNRLVSGWEIAMIEQIQTGNPINFRTTNTSFVGAGVLRPSIFPGQVVTGYSPALNGNATYVNYIQNPGIFSATVLSSFGNLGRNVVIGPGFSDLDIALVKTTAIRESMSLQFRADAFDALNQANFGQPGTSYGSGTFGQITNTRFPTGDSGSSRQLQLAMKFIF